MLYKMTDTTDQYTRKLKYNAFMGTIAICVIYAIVALAMILYINLTEQGKSLYSDLKPFALTFIFGTLFIIMAVTLMVVYWEPEQATKKEINDVLNNPLSCPDYYTLENTGADSNLLFKFSSNISILGNHEPTHKNLYIGLNTEPDKSVNLYDYAITKDNQDYIKHKCKKPDIIPDFDKDDHKKTREVFWANSDAATTTDYLLGTPVTATTFKSTELKNLKTLAAFTTMYGGYNNEQANTHDLLQGESDSTTVNIITPIGDGSKATATTGNTSAPLLTKVGSTSVPTTSSYFYDCSKVYPEYLARLDAKEYIDNNETGPKNLHRCGWAKACGVPWSSAGCS
jgi:hypothetical protein